MNNIKQKQIIPKNRKLNRPLFPNSRNWTPFEIKKHIEFLIEKNHGFIGINFQNEINFYLGDFKNIIWLDNNIFKIEDLKNNKIILYKNHSFTKIELNITLDELYFEIFNYMYPCSSSQINKYFD